jgi:hypothetical protein
MFDIKFCVKCGWNFRNFLKIHATFYKCILRLYRWYNMQLNNLSNKLLINVLVIYFIEKTRFWTFFFFKFKIWDESILVFFEAKPRMFFFYRFLRIPLWKIVVLKTAKMHPTELTKIYNKNKKWLLLNLTNAVKPTTKNVKKVVTN